MIFLKKKKQKTKHYFKLKKWMNNHIDVENLISGVNDNRLINAYHPFIDRYKPQR